MPVSAGNRMHIVPPAEKDATSPAAGSPVDGAESRIAMVHTQWIDSAANERLEPAPLEMFANDETLSKLLRAVESTNVAFEMQRGEPGQAEARAAAPIEPQTSASNLLTFTNAVTKPQPSAKEPRPEPPAMSLLVQDLAVSFPVVEAAGIESQESRAEGLGPRPRIYEVPLFSISEGIAEYQREDGQTVSLAPSPTPLTEPDAADWGLNEPLFKPPALLEDPEVPFFDKFNKQLRNHIPGVVVGLIDRLEDWLQDEVAEKPQEAQGPADWRASRRLLNPPVIAHYWTGGPPRASRIADLSASGLYLLTKDRWRPGSRISMTLQRTDQEHGRHGADLVVDFLVVRWGCDGIGGAFIPSLPGNRFNPVGMQLNCANKAALDEFLSYFNG